MPNSASSGAARTSRHRSGALIGGSIRYSIVDGNGLAGCGCPTSCPTGNISKWRNLVTLWYRRELAICSDRGVDRAEQALDKKRGSQKSPKQSIDSNTYKSPRGCTCHVAASGNSCPSASGRNLVVVQSLRWAPAVTERNPTRSPRIGCYLFPSQRSWGHPLLPKPLGATQTPPGHWAKSS